MVASASTFVDMGGLDLIVKSITLTPTPFTGVGNNVGTSGLVFESVQDGITAFAGGGQASATKLTAEVNRINTVASSGDSVALPTGIAGLTVYVINHGAQPMQVFGNAAAGDLIDDVATATGISQMQGSLCVYVCTTTGRWYSNGIGTGYASNFETMSSTDNLTAHAGGGQGSALLLPSMMNRVTTVATAADSVILPTSVRGMNIVVVNAAAANAMNVFPDVGAQINALGANTAFSLAAGKTATFYCATALQWHALLSA